MKWKPAALCCALFVLAGCATDNAAPALPKTAPPAAVCPPLKTYSPEEQKALAIAVEALPDGSPLVGAMEDYSAIRDASRACANPTPTH